MYLRFNIKCYILYESSKYAPLLIDDNAERFEYNLVFSFWVEFSVEKILTKKKYHTVRKSLMGKEKVSWGKKMSHNKRKK